MSEIPKKRQEYFDDLLDALHSGDSDKAEFLTRGKDPLAVRNDLSTILGQHVKENYDEPLNVFNNKEQLTEIPIHYGDLPKDVAGKYVKGKNGVYTSDQGVFLGKENPDLLFKQMGTKIHEYGHANDNINGFIGSQKFDKTKKLLGEGLQNAEDIIGQHHKSGFFEKEALVDLLKNKKLAMALPILKAAGIGALGMSAVGVGQKALAGDIEGAGVDAADTGSYFVPGLGEARMAGDLSMGELGNSELPPEEQEKKERFNKIQQRLLNK